MAQPGGSRVKGTDLISPSGYAPLTILVCSLKKGGAWTNG